MAGNDIIPQQHATIGLVLEGGGQRGMFTCGVLDVLMEEGILFGGMVGVSAGACYGVNYKSRQPGRSIRYQSRYSHDRRHMGPLPWLKTGNWVEADFWYNVIPHELDPWDTETFAEDPTHFFIVATDISTARPVYRELLTGDAEDSEWIRASASLPVLARPVKIGKRMYLDGGLTDSIPLAFMQEQGYERCLVVLTQPRGYFKGHSSYEKLLPLVLRRMPLVCQMLKERPEMYNAQLEYLDRQERQGNALIIAPETPIGISRMATDPVDLNRVYNEGRAAASRMLPQILKFMA